VTPTLNPFEPGFFENPYRQYAELRQHEPVHHSPLGVWVVFRYDDCFALLRDPHTSVEIRTELELHPDRRRARQEVFEEVFPDREPRESKSMLMVDPPDHTRLRKLVSKVFTPRRVEELRPLVQRLLDDLLDALPAGPVGERTVDLIGDIAFPLPFAVISEMLGMPDADRDLLRDWSGRMVRLLDPIMTSDEAKEAVEAADKMFDYVSEVIAWKRGHVADDLLSALVRAEEGGDMLSSEELADQVVLLFLAGHETTVNLIGNGMLALLRNRHELEALRDDPSLDANAVEELLRFDSPVQFSRRITTRELVLGDARFDAGEFVLTCLGAANHDPTAFGNDADRLDLRRPSASRHISFGSGVHHCLGAALARLEGQIVIGTLVRRFPDVELAVERPTWNDRIVLRGLSSLPVALGAPVTV
jgi:cytochrome P450